MSNDIEDKKIVTHDFPVWREKADFIIRIDLPQIGISDLATSEEIWARQIGDNMFEICCIPFFAYGVSLGDHVSTHSESKKKFFINKVIAKNGHTTYRLWLGVNG